MRMGRSLGLLEREQRRCVAPASTALLRFPHT